MDFKPEAFVIRSHQGGTAKVVTMC